MNPIYLLRPTVATLAILLSACGGGETVHLKERLRRQLQQPILT